MKRTSNPTIMYGLSAKDRLNRLWEEVESVRRNKTFVNPYANGQVPMGHEHIVQVRITNL